MQISQFSDVDGTDPERLRRALSRRATARLYGPYRGLVDEAVAAAPAGIVLDVGAGGGQAADRLSRLRPVIAVEPSAALCADARTRGVPVVRATGEQLPFPNSSVAGVLLERVLQHVGTVEAVLGEAARVMAPAGTLVVADPVHAAVTLEVPGLERLASRLCSWRAAAGTASPDAAARTAAWADRRGWKSQVEVFDFVSGIYDDARLLTNFPEWARLAAEDGCDVTGHEIVAWEEHFAGAKHGAASFELHWPVQVAVLVSPVEVV